MEDTSKRCRSSKRLDSLGRTQAEEWDRVGDPMKAIWELFLYKQWVAL